MDQMDGALDLAGGVDPSVELSTDAYVAELVSELPDRDEIELTDDALDKVKLFEDALEGIAV